MPERSERRYTWGRTADVDEHIELLKAEFDGLPDICHRHAALIVRIRRKIGLDSALAEFFALWDSRAEQLVASLSSRWLVSACDTFADYGTPFQRAAALMLSSTINTLKLAETERLLLRDISTDPAKLEAVVGSHAEQAHIDLWDGMTAYSVVAGDMPRNLLRRVHEVLGEDPVLAVIGRTLIDRALAADTVFGRLAKLNHRFDWPKEPPKQ